MNKTYLMAALGLMLVSPGCLGLFGGDDDEETGPNTTSASLTQQNVQLIEEVASGQFKNWTFDGQSPLDPVARWLNGTVGPGSAPGIEDRNDRSGNEYNTKLVVQDISALAPPMQPVELRIKLFYFGKLGSSADLDIYTNVPGAVGSYAPDSGDEFDWKVSVQEITLSTVRLPSQPFEVGVQIANERVLLEPLQYALKVEASFEEGVLAPTVPYAITVPEGAKALILHSAKAGGDEHIRGSILIIDPDDELVEFVAYNDIALASESKLVPITKPGEYVVYVANMTGGFIRVTTDVAVPSEIRAARALNKVVNPAVDVNAPSPGVVGREYMGAGTQYTEGGSTSFSVEGTFPLEIIATIGKGGQEVHGATQVKISSSKGLVYEFSRVLQVKDQSGTIGHSRDELNTFIDHSKLAKGAYSVSYVNDGNSEIGHIVVTYTR